jgi:hypothetical protein
MNEHATLLGWACVGCWMQLELRLQAVTPEPTSTAEPDAVSFALLDAVIVAPCRHMIVLAVISTPAIS